MFPRRSPARAPWLALAMAIPALLAGCADVACSPQEVPTTVALDLEAEEARTLPILTSGETRVAGQALPDAHGRLATVLSVAHPGLTNASLAFEDVQVRALRLDVRVGGASVPVEVLRVEGGSGWQRVGKNQWDGAAVNGSRLAFWWAVDRDAAREPLAILLEEGAPYVATVEFDWLHRSCVARASGHVSAPFSDFVQASANARTFAPAAPPEVEAGSAGVGLAAGFRIGSGLDVRVTDVEARAVWLGPSAVAAGANGTAGGAGVGVDAAAPAPGLALVAFPTLWWGVEGEAREVVTPADELLVRSADAQGRYARSGALLPPGVAPSGGVFLVGVEIGYEPTDATAGATRDAFWFAVRG